MPEIAKKLALDGAALAKYEALWEEADTAAGFLAAGAAVKFLGTSKLPQGDLKTIWGLSDTVAPKGKLSKDEFFCACKFVAVKQNGGELAAGSLSTATPAPKLGASA